MGKAEPRDAPPAPAPSERGALTDWLAASTQELLDALREAGPDGGCWTWWVRPSRPRPPAPSPGTSSSRSRCTRTTPSSWPARVDADLLPLDRLRAWEPEE
ncbi:maleylpyruvate isomerase N-terminal domain-containing protein [Streptomyces goshikiensis]|uniref:maleylpyruvate isomerase N-terminal domain-containing protein n=1 Tax=Streptomyces goshikiensis TaxID=1942 RepID=UPI00368E3A14